MKRYAIILSALLLAFLSLPSASFAAERGGGGYVAFRMGGYSPQSDDLEGFDTGFTGEVALGKQVSPHMTLEGAIGYLHSEDDRGAYTAEVESVPLTLTVLFHTRADAVEPYLLLGGGIYFNEASIHDDYFGDDDQSSASLGMHVGAGVNFHVSPTVFLSLETKYLWSTMEDLDGGDIDMDGFRTTVGLGIKF
jgi:opacity protein-like surface antigen